MTDAQSLADALGGVVRVRINEEELCGMSPRAVEGAFRNRLKQSGVKIPSVFLPKNAQDSVQYGHGTLSYHRLAVSDEVEAVWTPE